MALVRVTDPRSGARRCEAQPLANLEDRDDPVANQPEEGRL
jgi:hypothetical protein